MRTARLIVPVLLLVTGCAAADTPSGEAVPSERRPGGTSPRPAPLASPAPSRTPNGPPASPSPSASGSAVRLEVTGWWAWTLLDRRTGGARGSPNRTTETTSTESMVKAWLVADYLAGLRQREPTAPELALMRRAIRVSDDGAAEWLFRSRGGDATIRRMIATCELTGTRPRPGRWALTEVTAYDAARLGDCLADGAVLGPKWTAWLLREMRGVAASDGFGIREAFPRKVAARIAVKNGWTARSDTGQWHVACLGIWDHWSLAVLVRYPAHLGLRYGAAVCRDVTRQLFP